MDVFARKMLRASLAFAAVMLLMFAVLTVVYVHLHPRCSDQVVGSSTSPDHKWSAAVMERRCEDAPFLTHINLQPAADSIKLEYFTGKATEGEVFEIEQDAQSAPVELNWLGPTQLQVRCPSCDPKAVRTKNPRWEPEGITITYQFK